jgi:hypothetical protein
MVHPAHARWLKQQRKIEERKGEPRTVVLLIAIENLYSSVVLQGNIDGGTFDFKRKVHVRVVSVRLVQAYGAFHLTLKEPTEYGERECRVLSAHRIATRGFVAAFRGHVVTSEGTAQRPMMKTVLLETVQK